MKDPRQDKAWSDFQGWCRGHGLCPMPAHPWTVAAYVRWCEARRALRDIPPTLRAIAARHGGSKRRHPEQSPLVRRTLEIVERRRKKRQAEGAAPKLADLLAQPDLDGIAHAPRRPEQKVKTPRALRATPKLVSRRRLG